MTQIPPNGRGFIAGQTGTGKTTLASVLIRPMRHLLIVDPKHQFEPEMPARVVHEPNRLARPAWAAGREEWILYRPGPKYDNIDGYDRVFEWVYRRRNTFVYLDEWAALLGASSASFPLHLRALYMQGRGLGIGVLGVSQRPFNLPLWAISESEQRWKFFLALQRDQQRMAEYMGRTVLEPENFPVETVHENPYSFFYSSQFDRTYARSHVLNLR